MNLDKSQIELVLKITELRDRAKNLGQYESLITAIDTYRTWCNNKTMFVANNNEFFIDLFKIGEELFECLYFFDVNTNLLNTNLSDGIPNKERVN